MEGLIVAEPESPECGLFFEAGPAGFCFPTEPARNRVFMTSQAATACFLNAGRPGTDGTFSFSVPFRVLSIRNAKNFLTDCLAQKNIQSSSLLSSLKTQTAPCKTFEPLICQTTVSRLADRYQASFWTSWAFPDLLSKNHCNGVMPLSGSFMKEEHSLSAHDVHICQTSRSSGSGFFQSGFFRVKCLA